MKKDVRVSLNGNGLWVGIYEEVEGRWVLASSYASNLDQQGHHLEEFVHELALEVSHLREFLG